MIRTLFFFAGPVLLASGLASCFPDEDKREEQIKEWKDEIARMDEEIMHMKSDTLDFKPAPDWQSKLDEMQDQKILLDGRILENESALNQLKEERDHFMHRLEEFRITHPIN